MKSLTTLIVMFFISASVFAQKPEKKKIKVLKIAHITEQLDLTQKEAQKFWPIYNANEEAQNNLRDQSLSRRKNLRTEELTESQAKSLLLDMQKTEKQKIELNSKLLSDLLKIMPAKKIIKLYQAERSFRRKMLEEYKSRHARRN